MTRHWPQVAALALLASLLGCAKDPIQFRLYAVISGRVVAGTMGLPGVTVTLGGSSSAVAVTNNNGEFSFENLGDGWFTLTPARTGYYIDPPATVEALVPPFGSEGLGFTAYPATRTHSIRGKVSGTVVAGIQVRLEGAAEAVTLTQSDGSYRFERLLQGDYRVVPYSLEHTFTPNDRSITGTLRFEHTETGNGTLGTVSVTSITQNGQDMSALFDVTNPPTDGAGTIRVRALSELTPAQVDLSTYMWGTDGVVTIAFNSDLGVSTIDLALAHRPVFVPSSTSFSFHETLSDSTGIDFVASP